MDEKEEKHCYTPLDKVVIDYIKDLGVEKVIEMCAGDGTNAEKMREHAIRVEAFDLKTNEESRVRYGVSGTVEQNYDDHLLFIASGICSQKSIENYGGDYVLLGGNGENVTVLEEEEDVVTDMAKNEIKSFKQISQFSPFMDNRCIKLDIRPSHKYMQINFELDNMWFITRENSLQWTEILVFQLWKRKMIDH